MENCQVARAHLQSLGASVERGVLLTGFGLNYDKLGNVKIYTISMGQITFSLFEFMRDNFCRYLKIFPVYSACVVASYKKSAFYS